MHALGEVRKPLNFAADYRNDFKIVVERKRLALTPNKEMTGRWSGHFQIISSLKALGGGLPARLGVGARFGRAGRLGEHIVDVGDRAGLV